MKMSLSSGVRKPASVIIERMLLTFFSGYAIVMNSQKVLTLSSSASPSKIVGKNPIVNASA